MAAPFYIMTLTADECTDILVGLRMLQQEPSAGKLSLEEIDQLCERVNLLKPVFPDTNSRKISEYAYTD